METSGGAEELALRGDNGIRLTRLPDGKVVSTVRLGPEVGLLDSFLDPLLGRGGGPYETMVFESEDDFTDLDCRRYSTEQDARAGHDAVVAEWLKGVVAA